MGLVGRSLVSAPILHGGLIFPMVAPTEDTRVGPIMLVGLGGKAVYMDCPDVSSSTGSSRLMVRSPLLHGEINFTDREKETVKPSSRLSYRSSFKRQVIALP